MTENAYSTMEITTTDTTENTAEAEYAIWAVNSLLEAGQDELAADVAADFAADLAAAR